MSKRKTTADTRKGTARGTIGDDLEGFAAHDTDVHGELVAREREAAYAAALGKADRKTFFYKHLRLLGFDATWTAR